MFNALFIDNSPLNPPAKIASPCDGNEVATRSWRAMLSRAVDQVSEFPSKISTTCETPCSANGDDVSVCMQKTILCEAPKLQLHNTPTAT